MNRILALAAVLLIAVSALYFAQRGARHGAVSANAIVDVAADWQRDASRVPMRLTRLSDADEAEIGDQLARMYAKELPARIAEDHALEQYVNIVGNHVAARAKRKLLWHFHLLADPDLINAFALPGGHIFVGNGLLGQLNSEDKLAFVLAHEIEHVDHYHAAERVQVEAQLRHLDLQVVGQLVEIPMSLWQAGYSKNEEFEADREGLRLSVAAGYSAEGGVDLLQRWNKMNSEYVIHAQTPTDELNQLAIEGLTGYFRTHPLPSERLSQANEVIAQYHLPTDRPLKPFHIEYEIMGGSP